ncbi:serine hydrolase [Lamprobacter modestohalophilus]|uniref:serine hydrolase n=1 Tax=Lamprobacter modestohalophilus TaxID=1064514 RepID=UPI002ADEB9FA|nr:serine hydrolase [Lamprobacter modestohalophilus]MEA1051779.1 serine hydrolase [Lamprobacter modestohalophilus]
MSGQQDSGFWGAEDAGRGGQIGQGQMINRRQFVSVLGGASAALLLGASMPSAAARQSALQSQLVRLVKQQRAQGLIRSDEKTSWSVYDFTGGKKLVSINEDAPRQAASMLKPFVAQAFFYTMNERGSKLRYTGSVRESMEAMIRNSSNTATTELMQIVSRYNGGNGPKDVEHVLKRHAPGVFQQTSIVEYIPANGRTYRNLASAHDYSRFLWALWNNRMPNANEVRNLMGLPNHDRITKRVKGMPSTIKVYDKTGSTAMLCGNMGIIECYDRRGRPRPYTFIGIIEKSRRTDYYGTWITNRSNAMREVSSLVYNYMRQQHQLA